MLIEKTDEYYMQKALELAQQAFDENEVPIGAIIVCGEKIIGKGYNQVEKLNDPTAHAEMIALSAANQYFNSKYLKNSTLYVTVEPCIMCGGAAKWAHIDKIVYGTPDENFGFFSNTEKLLPSKTQIISGVLAEQCQAILLRFF